MDVNLTIKCLQNMLRYDVQVSLFCTHNHAGTDADEKCFKALLKQKDPQHTFTANAHIFM
jgi:hypothetical protein